MTRYFRLALLAGALAPGVAAAQGVELRLAAAAVPPAVSLDPARDSAIAQLESFLRAYPESPLRARALFQVGELLVQRADERFAETQRAAGANERAAPVKPNYAEAIARYEELVRRFPEFERIDAAAYTLGTLYAFEQRHADAERMFEMVVTRGADSSAFRSEAFFRLGDARFELAAQNRGTARRTGFAAAADAYRQAAEAARQGSDIYFLSLYKLGWSYYNQASRTNEQEYRQAVQTFGRLVDAYDDLTPEQQSRLGLRSEAIEYMAIAFTQVGGADAANQYFEGQGGEAYRRQVIGKIAESLRDQGAFPSAVEAYREYITLAPTDSAALAAQIQIVDIYQNRILEAEEAQKARLELVERFGPTSPWVQANPALASVADSARESALRQSAQFLLASAQERNSRPRFTQAAALYEQYLQAYPTADSARAARAYYAEALFGQGEFVRAGAAYTQAAFGGTDTSAFAERAARNAIVAFDSAVVVSRADAAVQDSLFAAVDRYVAAFPRSDAARDALRQKGRRASETKRWEVLAETFRTYARLYPNDPYAASAEKLVADALFQQGQYAEAQTQWEQAQTVARRTGRRALADSIAELRTAAAATFADTLIARGEYRRAAEEVYVAYAEANAGSERAPDALRNAIETYMLVVDSAQVRGIAEPDVRQAKERAIELSNQLAQRYPTYEYRLQYQSLAAELLADLGRRDEAVAALRTLVAENPRWPGRADAMIRLASTLDSLGRDPEAAAAYAEFSQAFPRDERAPDALYNAAVTYVEAGDSLAGARTFGTFAQRFPRDDRAGTARVQQVQLLRASGDSTLVATELARLCSGNAAGELRPVCAEREAARLFAQARGLFDEYRNERLVISSKARLNRSGVQRASATKQRLLRRITGLLTETIETGNPQYLAAATYHVGLAQWEYGRFLENVQLPEDLTPEEREAAQQGSTQQAQEFYTAARQTWQQLIDKAGEEPALGQSEEARPWLDRTRDALAGNVPEAPTTGDAGADSAGEGNS